MPPLPHIADLLSMPAKKTTRNEHKETQNDVKMAIVNECHVWVHGTTGISSYILAQWASVMKKSKLVVDDIIDTGLLKFHTDGDRESELYDLFYRILDQLLELDETHQTELQRLAKLQPVSGRGYYKHGADPLKALDEQGGLAAQRDSDLIGVRQRDLKTLTVVERVAWDQAIVSFELNSTSNNDSVVLINIRGRRDSLPEYEGKPFKKL